MKHGTDKLSVQHEVLRRGSTRKITQPTFLKHGDWQRLAGLENKTRYKKNTQNTSSQESKRTRGTYMRSALVIHSRATSSPCVCYAAALAGYCSSVDVSQARNDVDPKLPKTIAILLKSVPNSRRHRSSIDSSGVTQGYIRRLNFRYSVLLSYASAS